MTTTLTTGQEQILKVDRLGRVKTPKERREILLAEFDRSGMSGQQFAKWAGIKYGTFITWVQKRRRATTPFEVEIKPHVPVAPAPEVRWVEAVMENAPAKKSAANVAPAVMIVPGPGGVRLELSEEGHVLWAVKLLRHLDLRETC